MSYFTVDKGILKILLFLPALSDQYNTSPFDVIFTKIAEIMIKNNNTNIKKIAKEKSKNRFIG